jgi:hypothetical protein
MAGLLREIEQRLARFLHLEGIQPGNALDQQTHHSRLRDWASGKASVRSICEPSLRQSEIRMERLV